MDGLSLAQKEKEREVKSVNMQISAVEQVNVSEQIKCYVTLQRIRQRLTLLFKKRWHWYLQKFNSRKILFVQATLPLEKLWLRLNTSSIFVTQFKNKYFMMFYVPFTFTRVSCQRGMLLSCWSHVLSFQLNAVIKFRCSCTCGAIRHLCRAKILCSPFWQLKDAYPCCYKQFDTIPSRCLWSKSCWHNRNKNMPLAFDFRG